MINLPLRILAVIGAASAVVITLVIYDRVLDTRLEESHARLRQEFVADLTVALQKAMIPLNERISLLENDPNQPAVAILPHNNLTPKGSSQIEIFNLSSAPAYADASGTRVTGEIFNGTPRHFGLVVIALVALDAKGKVLHRQPILMTGVAAGERRAFESILNVPLAQFAAHRFELDTAR
jgi:hypothetical protein